MTRGRPILDIDLAAARQWLEDGLSVSEAAKRLRCARATLRSRLADSGFIASGNNSSPEVVEPVDELLERLGPDGMDRAMGAWLARRHCNRPALAFARPPGPARAPHYLAFVRELPCCTPGCKTPDPPNDPHHWGPHGIGQKTDDYRAMPLCRECHEQAHARGFAATYAQRRIIDTLILYTRIKEQT